MRRKGVRLFEAPHSCAAGRSHVLPALAPEREAGDPRHRLSIFGHDSGDELLPTGATNAQSGTCRAGGLATHTRR